MTTSAATLWKDVSSYLAVLMKQHNLLSESDLYYSMPLPSTSLNKLMNRSVGSSRFRFTHTMPTAVGLHDLEDLCAMLLAIHVLLRIHGNTSWGVY
jgi:hypothetical protein